MLRIKSRGLKPDTAFLKDSGALAALLQVADVDDLDALVDYITDNGNGRVALATDVHQRFVTCKFCSECDNPIRRRPVRQARLQRQRSGRVEALASHEKGASRCNRGPAFLLSLA
jgi:hypothetical protein